MYNNPQHILIDCNRPYFEEECIAMQFVPMRKKMGQYAYYVHPVIFAQFKNEDELIDHYINLHKEGGDIDPLLPLLKYCSDFSSINGKRTFMQVKNFPVARQSSKKPDLYRYPSSSIIGTQTMTIRSKEFGTKLLRYIHNGNEDTRLFDYVTGEPLEDVPTVYNGVTHLLSNSTLHHWLTARIGSNYQSVHKMKTSEDPARFLGENKFSNPKHSGRMFDSLICTIPVSLNHHKRMHELDSKYDGLGADYLRENNGFTKLHLTESHFNNVMDRLGFFNIDYYTYMEAHEKEWIKTNSHLIREMDSINERETFFDRFRKDKANIIYLPPKPRSSIGTMKGVFELEPKLEDNND